MRKLVPRLRFFHMSLINNLSKKDVFHLLQLKKPFLRTQFTLFTKLKFVSILLLWLLSIPSMFSQGALQEEPDPQRDLIRELNANQELRSLPDILNEYRSAESIEVILAAYGQLNRALTNLTDTLKTNGVESVFITLEQLPVILGEWSAFWNHFAFMPSSTSVRTQDIKLFYQQVSEIDAQISLQIDQINDLVNKERVLTGANFRFPD